MPNDAHRCLHCALLPPLWFQVRHISMNELWIQEKVSNGVISIVKIKNKFNPTDLLTKRPSKDEIAQIVDALCHEFSKGRNEDAPELAMVSEIMDGSIVTWQCLL